MWVPMINLNLLKWRRKKNFKTKTLIKLSAQIYLLAAAAALWAELWVGNELDVLSLTLT